MPVRSSSNRNYVVVTVLICLLVGWAWHLMTRTTKEQIQQAERDGVTIEGATPDSKLESINRRIRMQAEMHRAAEQEMSAAQYGQLDVIRWFYDKSRKPNARDMHGNTPPFYAARYGQAAALRLLLEHGADLHARNDNELNLLDMAILGRHADVYAFLRDHGLKVNLRQAAQMNDVRSLDRLLQGGAKVNAVYPSVTPSPLNKFYPLLTERDWQNFPRGGVASQALSLTPLRNRPPLYFLTGDDHDYRTALSGALEVGPSEAAIRLLSHGARVDAKDDYGMTALMYAARSGNLAAIQFLRRHGAKPDVRK